MDDTSISHNKAITIIYGETCYCVCDLNTSFFPQPRKSQVLDSLFNFDSSTCDFLGQGQ